MKRLLCLLNGHHWHALTRTCSRCHAPHELLLILDALKPLLDSFARLSTAYEAAYRLQTAKPEVEVVRQLTEEEQRIMNTARLMPQLRDKLPSYLRSMLEEEETEVAH